MSKFDSSTESDDLTYNLTELKCENQQGTGDVDHADIKAANKNRIQFNEAKTKPSAEKSTMILYQQESLSSIGTIYSPSGNPTPKETSLKTKKAKKNHYDDTLIGRIEGTVSRSQVTGYDFHSTSRKDQGTGSLMDRLTAATSSASAHYNRMARPSEGGYVPHPDVERRASSDKNNSNEIKVLERQVIFKKPNDTRANKKNKER